MLRLLSIEYFKLRHTKYFWILLSLFALFLIAVPIASKAFMDYLASQGEDFFDMGISPSELPLFDFVDIWQNLTWVYKSFSVFLGFIMVISVSNEFSYGTLKQNVIDGMSPREFLLSKIWFIVALSAIVSLVVLIIGLVMGFLWSPVKEFTFIVKHIEFIPAYFLHLVAFQLFCMVVALLIRRPGITLALLIFYVYVVEKIITAIIQFEYKLPWLADLFPVRAIGNIIRLPFGKYILQETQTTVAFSDLGIMLVYVALLLFIANWRVTRRDLR